MQLMIDVFDAWYMGLHYAITIVAVEIPRAIPPPTADPGASASLPGTPERSWPDTDDEYY